MPTRICTCSNPLRCEEPLPPADCLIPNRKAARIVGDELEVDGAYLLADVRRGRLPLSVPYQTIQRRVWYGLSEIKRFVGFEKMRRK